MIYVKKSPSGLHWVVIFKSTELETFDTKAAAEAAAKKYRLTYSKMARK